MEFLNWVGDVIYSFLKHLPQYAALITASVAIILFIIKEKRDKNKKIIEEEKDKEKERKEVLAIKKILGRESFSILKQVEFFIDIYERKNNATKVKLDIMPDNFWRQINIAYKIDGFDVYSEFIMIPDRSNVIDNLFMMNAIKMDPELFNVINMLNRSILSMRKSIDSCMGSAMENNVDKLIFYSNLMISGIKENGHNLVEIILSEISCLKNEMSVYDEYQSIVRKINRYYKTNL